MSNKTSLREYQKSAIKLLFDSIRDGFRSIIWSLPTGAGKSTMTSGLVDILRASNKRILFTVHSRELVDQFSKRLWNQFGIASGIIMAGRKPSKIMPVQVSSIQSIVRRNTDWFKPDILIIDECHRAKANSYLKLIERYPGAILLGLTATPFRGNGAGLGGVFDKIIQPVKIQDLINQGFLTPTKVYASKHKVDLTGVKIVRGDYDEKQLFDKYNNDVAYDSVVKNYQKWANGKRTIVFNINVEHSKNMNQAFLDAGIRSAHLDGSTSKAEREDKVKKFALGEIDVLNNVALFIEGFDVPAVECVILNQATKSLVRYVQEVGRGLRKFDGKEFCVVLDHGDNTITHGFVEDYDQREFTLDGMKKKSKKMENLTRSTMRKCPKCFAIMKQGVKECYTCGYKFKTQTKKFGNDIELKMLTRDAQKISSIQNKRFEDLLPSEVRIFQKMRKYHHGWAYHQCRNNFDWKLPDGKEGRMAASFLMSLEEMKDGTYDYVKQLTK